MADADRDYCPTCGAEIEVERCWQCHGAGGWDAYEIDPITEEPGAWEICNVCRATGHLTYCPDAGEHTSSGRTRVTEQPTIIEDCHVCGDAAATEAPDMTITDAPADVKDCSFDPSGALDATVISGSDTGAEGGQGE